jgi:hypothetical protein
VSSIWIIIVVLVITLSGGYAFYKYRIQVWLLQAWYFVFLTIYHTNPTLRKHNSWEYFGIKRTLESSWTTQAFMLLHS